MTGHTIDCAWYQVSIQEGVRGYIEVHGLFGYI